MNRRHFLQLSGTVAALSALPRLVLSGEPAVRKPLVCIFLRGGADGLNLIVPAADPHYYDLRPTLAIAEPGAAGGALALDDYFGLHPSMESLMPLFREGSLAIVHAAGSPHDSRSHFDAQDFMETGYTGKGVVYDGWLNRHMHGLIGTSDTFSAVSVGPSLPVSLQGAFPALGIDDVQNFEVQAPAGQQQAFESALRALYDGTSAVDLQAHAAFDSAARLAESGVQEMMPANGAAYPEGGFGSQLASLAALLKSGIGVEVACVELGGWDHHDQEQAQLGPLAAELADGMAAFYTDLGDQGSEVTTVTMTEFGRRAAENGSRGTDHGHGSFMMVAGGGVRGGSVLGEWPGLGPGALNRGDLEVTTDFRAVLSEILIKRRQETAIDAVFPEYSGARSAGLFS